MSAQRNSLLVLLILQILALLIYPPAFFQRAPEAQVLPLGLGLLYVLALIGMNTQTLTPISGRTSLIFLLGVNIVVRMLLLFPNLKFADGGWDWALLLTQLFSCGLSWFIIGSLEKRPLNSLLIVPTRN